MHKDHEVSIEEVVNGFLVQSRNPTWQTCVALTLDGALVIAKDMMQRPLLNTNEINTAANSPAPGLRVDA